MLTEGNAKEAGSAGDQGRHASLRAAAREATRIFVDDWDVARSESGDLIAADTQLGLDWNSVHPLSSLVGNLLPGRKTPEDITLFESHGMGLEDLAAACCVLEQARRYGVGKQVPLH